MTAMALDIGLDDAEALKMLARAVTIVQSDVIRLHDQLGEMPYDADCEVYRLTRALPPGPISFDRTVLVAADAARSALEQVSTIVRHLPTTPIVIQALLRVALVGAARAAFALLPDDPDTRLENARVLVAQESGGFVKALDQYAAFQHLTGLRPAPDYVNNATDQHLAIQQGRRPPGDGVVLQRVADQLGAALSVTPEYADQQRQQLAEHVTWLWNTLSGLAHTHAWPKLLPAAGSDRRSPGNFAADFHMIAVMAHVALLAVDHRRQPGSANTRTAVPLT